MVDQVVAKMKCGWVGAPGGKLGDPYVTAKVRLNAVYKNDPEGKKENAIFGDSTPNGSVEMSIANPIAARYFIPDLEYKIYFVLDSEITEAMIDQRRSWKEEAEASMEQAKTRLDGANTTKDASAIARASEDYKNRAQNFADRSWQLEQLVALYAGQQKKAPAED